MMLPWDVIKQTSSYHTLQKSQYENSCHIKSFVLPFGMLTFPSRNGAVQISEINDNPECQTPDSPPVLCSMQ